MRRFSTGYPPRLKTGIGLYIPPQYPYFARLRRTRSPSSAANAGLGSTICRGLRELHTYHTPLDLVRERSPERPVALVRPDAVALAAHWFQDNFKGDVLYAVKANPSPWVIETLAAHGVRGFDVASIPEIELVRAYAPDARLAFMHPVKSRAAIKAAYFEHGVRTFAVDTLEELDKVLAVTGRAKDLNLIVRLAVDTLGAAYSLSGKFGVDPRDRAGQGARAGRQAGLHASGEEPRGDQGRLLQARRTHLRGRHRRRA